MKKVLIITYYWPPSGGSGVQRWLKFVKYLPSCGWEPHVFVPENASYAILDPSLEKDVPAAAEVIRFPIWEPYELFFRMSRWFARTASKSSNGVASPVNRTFFGRLSTWVRGNLFIPDPRRFWVKPSVKFLADYIVDNAIENVITTGPPHSVHLIGLRLKRRTPGIRWFADFRDPWTEWGLWDSLMVSSWARRLHRRLEAKVLAAADEIITITPFYAGKFEQLARRPVRLLTNGFDEADFQDIRPVRTDNFVIRHIGIINDKCDPRPFLRAMRQTMSGDASFARDVRLEFIGEVYPDVKQFVMEDGVLQTVTSFPGSVPHDELISLYGSSSLLLLILTGYKDAEGFLPGKLFEYLATGLPVLGVGPVHGDAAALLERTGVGVMVDSADHEGIKVALQKAYAHWKKNGGPRVDHARVGEFSRKHITGQLASLLSLR